MDSVRNVPGGKDVTRASAKLTSKGQVTVPKEIRTILKVKTGDRIDFVVDGEGKVLMQPKTKLRDLLGMFERPGRRATSVEEMNSAIGRHCAEDDERIMNGIRRR